MAGLRLLFIAALFVAVGGKSVQAQVHHVVGSDPSDIGTWSTGRLFKVGDHICKLSLSSSVQTFLISQTRQISCNIIIIIIIKKQIPGEYILSSTNRSRNKPSSSTLIKHCFRLNIQQTCTHKRDSLPIFYFI